MFKRITNRINLRDFPRAVWVVAGMNVIGGIGWATSFTYISLFLYQERQMPMTLVGIVLLISGLLSGLSQVIGGLVGDRFGHRRAVFLFGLGNLLAATVLAVLIIVEAPTWIVILFAILVQMIGSGGVPPLNAIIASAAPQSKLTESYSLMAIAGNISWSIGPLLGGYLLGFASFGLIFGIGAVMRAFGLLGVIFLPRDEKTGAEPVRQKTSLLLFSPNPTVLAFGLLSALFFMVMSQWGGTLQVFTIDHVGFSTAQYGLLMSVSGILIITFQYPISHRMAAQTRGALVLGCLFYSIGFLSLAWVKSFLPAVGSIIIMVVGEMFFVPSALAAVGQMSGHDDKGKNMGFYGLCSNLGFSLGPLFGGFLLDRYIAAPLYVWGPVSLCTLIAALGYTVWKGYVVDGNR